MHFAVDVGPAEVFGDRWSAGIVFFNLLVVGSYFAEKEDAGLRLTGDGVGIAQAQGDDGAVTVFEVPVVRVVYGNGAVFVDPQKFTKEIAGVLRVRSLRVFAGAQVEFAILPEGEAAAIVPSDFGKVIDFKNDLLAAGDDNISFSGEAAHAIVARSVTLVLWFAVVSVVEIEPAVGGEFGIETNGE